MMRQGLPVVILSQIGKIYLPKTDEVPLWRGPYLILWHQNLIDHQDDCGNRWAVRIWMGHTGSTTSQPVCVQPNKLFSLSVLTRDACTDFTRLFSISISEFVAPCVLVLLLLTAGAVQTSKERAEGHVLGCQGLTEQQQPQSLDLLVRVFFLC